MCQGKFKLNPYNRHSAIQYISSHKPNLFFLEEILNVGTV
jgi:hypothetical protein